MVRYLFYTIGDLTYHSPLVFCFLDGAFCWFVLSSNIYTFVICWLFLLLPYHLHLPIVLKSGSPKLLEPPGPVQAYNGIALP